MTLKTTFHFPLIVNWHSLYFYDSSYIIYWNDVQTQLFISHSCKQCVTHWIINALAKVCGISNVHSVMYVYVYIYIHLTKFDASFDQKLLKVICVICIRV